MGDKRVRFAVPNEPSNQTTEGSSIVEVPGRNDEENEPVSNVPHQEPQEEDSIQAPNSSDDSELRDERSSGDEVVERCTEMPNTSDDTVLTQNEPANLNPAEQEIIEVLNCSDEEDAGQNSPQAYCSGDSSEDSHVEVNRLQQQENREGPPGSSKKVEVVDCRPWLAQLPEEASCMKLFCIWLRKCYRFLTLGVLCVICSIIAYAMHPVFKHFKGSYVTPTAILLSGLVFLAGPFVRLWELINARGPRIIGARALRNMMNLA